MDQHACEILPRAELEPCTIIIFGGSGDLTSRKLIPALLTLFNSGQLPEHFSIIGCSRTRMTDRQYREHLQRSGSAGRSAEELQGWQAFSRHLHYFPLEYNPAGFARLAAHLRRQSGSRQPSANLLFELAVPPRLYPLIGELLGQAGLADQTRGWSRLVVEKPFGHDLATARSLNTTLHQFFQEEQLFRIDHYLAKETIQNLLIFRFANAIFEPIWNRRYIDSVQIMAAEQLGVGTRAGFYEQAGVIRDMFQNHLMQLLVLTAMEPPYCLEAEAVHDEKIKVIRSLRTFSAERGSAIRLGQYSPGIIAGSRVPGYREEAGVAPHSTTPTYARLTTYVDNWRWQGVPFFLVSGKRLPRKQTRITIQFKAVPHSLFSDSLGDGIRANTLTIETYPEEAIRLSFQTKNPSPQLCLRTMEMDFAYHEHYPGPAPDAYGRVLLDCMLGDQLLFWRQDGIEASWAFLEPVLEACADCGGLQQLHFYPAGSEGP
ncbi:glucose-6-phosphate dehydrogenase [Desulfogranum mediterraneum]|uniref:glucose-6-phosphate dehydrogenase n=1 Tax=Desulfogranum mediterraneum TaxID=160661 RepID=UPI00040D0894|nr:glucose-6-phosphate dehydrogenase [Desulfogranum mediterraneum]